MASVAEAQQSTQNALSAAVAARTIAAEDKDFASKILSRLETPTRVTLMGMPKSGKTSIFNMLAGREIVPEGLAATVQLVHGETEKVTATLRDGSKLEFEGPLDMQRVGSLTPAFVKIEMDLPALRKISLLEVVTAHDRVEQIRAMTWAMKQTDIAIWCSSEYNAAEQALWEHAPDRLKDHAILVRARADELGSKREAMLNYLKREAGGDFAYFLAVSGHEAALARAGEQVDKVRLKNSGAMALISTILRQIEQGRQYAVDQAEILLHKYKNAKPRPKTVPTMAQPAPEPEPVEEPLAETLEAEMVEEQPVAEAQPEPVVEEAPAEEAPQEAAEPDRSFEEELEAEIEAMEAEEAEPAPEPLAEEEREAFEAVVIKLEDLGDRLTGNEADTDMIIKSSMKTLDWLNEFLMEERWPDTDSFDQFRDMSQGASDLMQLLKIERDDNSAMDAVSAMLQLKRGFQTKLAA